MRTLVVMPSFNRTHVLASRIGTLRWLPYVTHEKYIAVRTNELATYEPLSSLYDVPLLELTDAHDMASTRDEIVAFAAEEGYEKLVMLDDDLYFSYRHDFSSPNMYTLENTDIDAALNTLLAQINEKIPFGTFMTRAFGNNPDTPFTLFSKVMWSMACYVPVLRKYSFSWGAPCMSDFYMTLRLLSDGYATIRCNTYLNDDSFGSSAPGGCSTYRTTAMQSKSAEELQKHFPEYVSLRMKHKGNWSEPVTDVIVQWKRAFNKEKFAQRFAHE